MRVASFGRPAGDDGRKVERCFAGFQGLPSGVRQREGTGRCTVVEKPANHRGIVLPGREVQRRDTMDITRTDERRVGFHQGDGLRGAALGDGLPQRIDRRCGWASPRG